MQHHRATAPAAAANGATDEQTINLKNIKQQIYAHVIERRDEMPCAEDVELLAHACASELADDVFVIASTGKWTMTELIDTSVTGALRALRITQAVLRESAPPIEHAASATVQLVFVQLAVVGSMMNARASVTLGIKQLPSLDTTTSDAHFPTATLVEPLPLEVTTFADAGVERNQPAGNATNATVSGRPPGEGPNSQPKPDLWDIDATPMLMMHCGALATNASGGDEDHPDLTRIGTVMNEAGLPSADLILLMPTAVTYDEYIDYIMSLTADQVDRLLEDSDAAHGSQLWSGDEPFGFRRPDHPYKLEHRR